MNRTFLSILALATVTVTASAQCFESNFGVLMPRGTFAPGVGDDYLFDLQPMSDGVGGGISYPMGAVPTNYTHAHVGTNGVIFLTTGAASGATTTGYSTTAAGIVTNLLGTAGQPPRIAPYWRDLNMLATNGGGVYFNNTIPGKFVVTWLNAVHYGQTTPVFTCQAQLHGNGRVDFYYGATAQNTAICPVVGISEGNAVADPGAIDLTAGSVGISTTQIVYETFATLSTFDLANKTVSFLPNALGGFDVVSAPCIVANASTYGTGCMNIKTSIYEAFAASTIDLGAATGTNSLAFLPNGQGGYIVTQGSNAFYTPTSPDLLLSDDSLSPVQALPFTFNFPGGSTTSITLCSNGYVWLDPAQTIADLSGTSAELLSLAPRMALVWNDLNPTYTDPITTLRLGSIHFEVDPVSGDAICTWLNVPQFGTSAAPLLNTFQLALRANGSFEYRFQNITTTNIVVTGFSEGIGANDPGGSDLSSAWTVPLNTGVRAAPLRLVAASRPITGTTANLVVSELPGASPLGILLLSFTQFNPGIDLTPLGMPTCFQYSGTDVPTFFVPAGSSFTYPLVVPNNPSLSGLPVYSQAAAFAASLNPLGIITSNGLAMVLGTL